MFRWLYPQNQSDTIVQNDIKLHSDSTPYPSCIWLLIEGYLKKHNLFAPTDIMLLIIKSFINPVNINQYIIGIQSHTITLYDITTGFSSKHIPKRVNVKEMVTNIHSNVTVDQHCYLNNGSLPNPCYQTLHSSLHSNRNWKMIAHIGGTYNDAKIKQHAVNYCSLTAIDASYTQALNFPLPPLPSILSHPAAVYSSVHHKIYVMNHQQANAGKTIHELDMLPDKSPTKWDWKLCSTNLTLKRKNTSICLVDKDRYIAIMGGQSHAYLDDVKSTELFSFRNDKSILLADMCLNRKNAASVYHDMFHKIIVVGGTNRPQSYQLEVYDINKDRWTMLYRTPHTGSMMTWGNSTQQVLISPANPNVLMCFLYDKTLRKHKLGKIDLRTNTEMNEMDMRTDVPHFPRYLFANLATEPKPICSVYMK
eukprot:109840_1